MTRDVERMGSVRKVSKGLHREVEGEKGTCLPGAWESGTWGRMTGRQAVT